MGIFNFLFGKQQNKILEYLNNDAIILDVRTEKEYKSGAITGSKNVPLQDLQNQIESLKSLSKPFIVCCASGVRSAKATKFLNLNNIEAINGGGWQSLKRTIDN